MHDGLTAACAAHMGAAACRCGRRTARGVGDARRRPDPSETRTSACVTLQAQVPAGLWPPGPEAAPPTACSESALDMLYSSRRVAGPLPFHAARAGLRRSETVTTKVLDA